MERFIGLVGIVLILLIALLMSDNRKKISIKTATPCRSFWQSPNLQFES